MYSHGRTCFRALSCVIAFSELHRNHISDGEMGYLAGRPHFSKVGAGVGWGSQSYINGEWRELKVLIRNSRVAKSDLNSTEAYLATKN